MDNQTEKSSQKWGLGVMALLLQWKQHDSWQLLRNVAFLEHKANGGENKMVQMQIGAKLNRLLKGVGCCAQGFTLYWYNIKAISVFIHENNMIRSLFQKDYTARVVRSYSIKLNAANFVRKLLQLFRNEMVRAESRAGQT